MSPFEALYGKAPTNFLYGLVLPSHVLNTLRTEDDLIALARARCTQKGERTVETLYTLS